MSPLFDLTKLLSEKLIKKYMIYLLRIILDQSIAERAKFVARNSLQTVNMHFLLDKAYENVSFELIC